MAKLQSKRLVVCIKNDGYPAALEKRKIYVALRDTDAEKHDLMQSHWQPGRGVYPRALFRAIALPQSVRKAVLAAA